MTVYNTAYDTTACANFRMEATVQAIKEARVSEWLPSADGVSFIEDSRGAKSIVKAFRHALYVSKHDCSDIRHSNEMRLEPYLAMDMRACGVIDKSTGKFKVNNSTLYKNTLYRAGLTSLWLAQGPNAFRAFTPVATGIFATWIAETLSFRYNLDLKTKVDLMILAAIFYASNHVEGLEFAKANENRVIAQISSSLKGYANFEAVETIYAVTKCITSIEDFCAKAKDYIGNVKLENLNAGTLITLMGGTWSSDNPTELCAVAMEHPPTWIAMIYEAQTNLGLRKVGLSRICERRIFQDGLENLASSMKSLMPETSDYLTARTNQI